MAPTIMVARVALLAPNDTHPSTTPHISELQFNGRFGAPNDTLTRDTINSIVPIEHDSSSSHTNEKPIV